MLADLACKRDVAATSTRAIAIESFLHDLPPALGRASSDLSQRAATAVPLEKRKGYTASKTHMWFALRLHPPRPCGAAIEAGAGQEEKPFTIDACGTQCVQCPFGGERSADTASPHVRVLAAPGTTGVVPPRPRGSGSTRGAGLDRGRGHEGSTAPSAASWPYATWAYPVGARPYAASPNRRVALP